MSDSVIDLKGVAFASEGHPLLADIDLAVPDGAVVALIGGSRAATSALVRLVAGLETPSAGRVRVSGRDVDGPDRQVALVGADPALLPWRSVAGNVGLARDVLPAGDQPDQDRVRDFIEAAGLGDRADVMPDDLTPGERQRAAVARAMVTAPDVLALDDPFARLDVFDRESLWTMLQTLRGRTTCLLATGDLREAVYLAGQVAILGGTPARLRSTLDIDVAREDGRTDIYGSMAANQLSILRQQIDVARGRAPGATPASPPVEPRP